MSERRCGQCGNSPEQRGKITGGRLSPGESVVCQDNCHIGHDSPGSEGRSEEWAVTICQDCGAVNPPSFPASACMKGTGSLGHKTKFVRVVPATLLAQAEERAEGVIKARNAMSHGFDEMQERATRAERERDEAKREADRLFLQVQARFTVDQHQALMRAVDARAESAEKARDEALVRVEKAKKTITATIRTAGLNATERNRWQATAESAQAAATQAEAALEEIREWAQTVELMDLLRGTDDPPTEEEQAIWKSGAVTVAEKIEEQTAALKSTHKSPEEPNG